MKWTDILTLIIIAALAWDAPRISLVFVLLVYAALIAHERKWEDK